MHGVTSSEKLAVIQRGIFPVSCQELILNKYYSCHSNESLKIPFVISKRRKLESITELYLYVLF
jgi:hypothetical protein